MCTRLIEGSTLRFGALTATVFNGVSVYDLFFILGISTHAQLSEYNARFGLHYASAVVLTLRILLSYQITYFALSFLVLPCLILGIVMKHSKDVFIFLSLVLIGSKLLIETALLIALSGLTTLLWCLYKLVVSILFFTDSLRDANLFIRNAAKLPFDEEFNVTFEHNENETLKLFDHQVLGYIYIGLVILGMCALISLIIGIIHEKYCPIICWLCLMTLGLVLSVVTCVIHVLTEEK
uniref:Uncharacterized protein n=1 Tax=Strigamia maritima TaxID=126957 RepID=T1J808_STRMM